MSPSSCNDYQYLFGPVPSRRFGRSLGVDLVPMKTCPLNCVYCQLGPTAHPTTQRAEYLPTEAILEEIQRRVQRADFDVITLSGSGEPTLHSELGRIVEHIKQCTDKPLVLLTNGVLFQDPEVRRACLPIDILVPSLDAGDEKLFQYINRPAPGWTLERLVTGLETFRPDYAGQIWLEVFLLGGVNDMQTEIRKIKTLADRIHPDRIQLNTVTRPAAEEFAFKTPEEQLQRVQAILGPKAEIIASSHKGRCEPAAAQANREQILAMLRRRPCTLEDIAQGLGASPNEVVKYIEELASRGRVTRVRTQGRAYYKATT